jgi:hypothetical protein
MFLMMKFDDFTKKQRNIIAEFVFSFEKEILIKTDAVNLVDVFLEKKMIDTKHAEDLKFRIDKNHSVLEEMMEIIFTSIEDDEGKKIMSEYSSCTNTLNNNE